MTPHEYLVGVLQTQALSPEEIQGLQDIRNYIEGVLRASIGSVPRFYYGGSYGKKTMIRIAYDLDIVVYFPNTDTRPVELLYWMVNAILTSAKLIVNPKNVALRLPYNQFHVDVVPGRAQDSSFVYATLYKNEDKTTLQTSIKVHIDSVRACREIVRLIKLWRFRHAISWETFALEITVLRALDGRRKDDYGNAMRAVFEFIRDNIGKIRLVDPANSNNVIDMNGGTRLALLAAAHKALSAKNWAEIAW